jgi:hypothetical protein
MARLAYKYNDFSNYTLKLLRKLDSSGTMTTDARELFDRYMGDVQKRLLGCVVSRSDSKRLKTIHVEDVSAVLRFLMPSILNKTCRTHISRSFDNIREFDNDVDVDITHGVRKKRITVTERSKLLYTPSRIVTFIKRDRPDIRVTPSGCVALSSTLQCVAEVIMEEALRTKNECRRNRITASHIEGAVKDSELLRDLFCSLK